MLCRTQESGRPSGSRRKGGECWPAAGEGMREDAETLPGCFSTLLSHTGTFETRGRWPGQGEGGSGDGNLLTFPARITVGIGGGGPGGGEGSWEEVGRRVSCSFSLFTASSPPHLPPGQGCGPPRPHSLDTLVGPHPQGQGTGLPTPLRSQGSLDSYSPHPRSLSPPWAPLSLYPKDPSSSQAGPCRAVNATLISVLTSRHNLSSPHYAPMGSLTN